MGTKVAFLLCVLQPRQRSRRPEGSHSKAGCRACEGSCIIILANRSVCWSWMEERVLVESPIILEQTLAVLSRRFLFWRVMEWNQQVMENVQMLSMKE